MNNATNPVISTNLLEDMVKGVIIIQSESGLPLFSRMNKNVDSVIFSGVITAINSLSEELSLGSLSLFTTASHQVYFTSKEHVTVALLMDNVHKSVAFQLINQISNCFEQKYIIPGIPNSDNYSSFQNELDIIIRDFFAAKEKNMLYLLDDTEHFILANTINLKDYIEQSVMINCSIPDKKIYIMYNTKNIPNRLKYLAQQEAKRINTQLLDNKFSIRDIYDEFELEYLFSKINTSSK